MPEGYSSRPHPVHPPELKAKEQREESRKYHTLKNGLFFAGLLLDLVLLCGVFFSGLTFTIKEFALRFSSHTAFVNAIYLFCLGAGACIVHFPLSFIEGYWWEHRFKLSNQSLSQWLKDDLKKSLLSFVLVLILVEALYLFLNKMPEDWWVASGIFWLFFSIFLARITPNFIIPLFYKYLPLKDQDLKVKIFALFKKCQVGLKDIHTIDLSSKTKKANAFLCGIGKERRVVLSDTLLSHFTSDEIEVVVAHELGHYKHRDIVKLLFVNGVTIFIGLYLLDCILGNLLLKYGIENIGDISGLPLMALILSLFGLVTTPLLNAFSRYVETQADRFSLETTKKKNEFVTTMEKLGKMNLAEFEPGRFIEFFFYDHPPLKQRIEFAKKYAIID